MLRFVLISILTVLASGCTTLADVENIQDRATEPAPRTDGNLTVGQSFVSHYAGLQAIEVLPVVYQGDTAPPGILTFRLLASDKGSNIELANSQVKIADLAHNVPRRLEFSPVADSKDRPFYFSVEVGGTAGESRVSLWSTKQDRYPQGSLYVDGKEAAGDLTFRTYYQYSIWAMLADLARGIGEHFWALVPLIAIFLLPGYVLLTLHPKRADYDAAEVIALSTGLSIAAIGVGFLFAKLSGLRIDDSSVRLGAGLLAILSFVVFLRGRLARTCMAYLGRGAVPTPPQHPSAEGRTTVVGRACPLSLWSFPRLEEDRGKDWERVRVRASPARSGYVPFPPLPQAPGSHPWPSRDKALFSACLALVVLVTAAIRYLHIRDAIVPLWVDSVQHAEIVELIVANGGLPDSYRPFVDLEPFSYHFGFHASVALFHWLAGIDMPGSMLVVGQALNVLMVLSTYALANRLMRSRIAGLVSAAVVGLISVMPAYYVTWGRYTQLAGMVMLPIAIVLMLDLLGASRGMPSLRLLALAAITTGGLVIAHPRVTVFYLCFLVAYLGLDLVSSRRDWRDSASRLLRMIIVLGSGFVLVSPWVWTILGSIVARTWRGASMGTASYNPFPFGYVTSLHDKWLIAIAAGGLLLALRRWRSADSKHVSAWLVGAWACLMILSANIDRFGLPGATMIGNGALAIALFLPLALLDGYLVSALAKELKLLSWPFAAKLTAAVGLIAIGLYGAQGLLGVVNPITSIFLRQDRAAMEWIAGNTPRDAKFLINTYHWQFGMYVGSDGGYWIPALTGRKASLPSLVYTLGGSEGTQAISLEAEQAANGALIEAEMKRFLKDHGIGYIYLGYRGGSLLPDKFTGKPGYETVYAKGGVWVFKVVD